MPYTLAKMLVWLVLAVGLGVITGWLLRNVTARRQVARAKSHRGQAAELDRLHSRIATLESTIADRDRRIADLEERSAHEPPTARPDDAVEATPESAAELDEAAPVPAPPVAPGAADVLGHPIAVDDLQAIEGIGPNIADLCHGIGIRTWSDLAATEVSLLRTMLDDAGARFKTADPSTWPQQAELLARHDWEQFKALTDELRAGSST